MVGPFCMHLQLLLPGSNQGTANRKYFEHAGGAAHGPDGSGDELIKLEGVPRGRSALDASDGSGLEFLRVLRDRAAAANPSDVAVAEGKFAKIRQDLIQGALTVSSLKEFLAKYKKARRNVAPATRPMLHTVKNQREFII